VTFLADDPPVVIDASVAVGVVTGDAIAAQGFQSWVHGGRMILAPPVFLTEVANVLVRRRRRSAVDVTDDLVALRDAGVELGDRGFDGLAAAIVLADRHTLSVYDATYLWLAMDVDGELATFDKALIRAAKAEGVELAIRA
jgi:predicted nucleic acid-binding protein